MTGQAYRVDLGFDHENVLVVRLDLRLHGYDEAAAADLFARATDAIKAAPGVVEVARAGPHRCRAECGRVQSRSLPRAAGLFGVIAYAVERRTAEIGLRLALGARAGQVMRLMMGQGLRLAAGGLGIGLALAWIVARALTGVIPGLPATDWAPWRQQRRSYL